MSLRSLHHRTPKGTAGSANDPTLGRILTSVPHHGIIEYLNRPMFETPTTHSVTHLGPTTLTCGTHLQSIGGPLLLFKPFSIKLLTRRRNVALKQQHSETTVLFKRRLFGCYGTLQLRTTSRFSPTYCRKSSSSAMTFYHFGCLKQNQVATNCVD
jgi:hypothetical protein